MVSNLSKWKNVFGEIDKSGSFDSLNPRLTSTSDGSLIDVSPDHIAVNWQTTGGGAVGVFQTKNFIRVKSDFPLIYGHKGTVTDIKFNLFNSSLLATSSEDGTVKLWQIPQEGIKEDLRTETQAFSGHTKKAMLINWNPTVGEIIASMGNDNDLCVWDIRNAEILHKIKTDDSAFSMEWNLNGSLIGSLLKNRRVHVFDVRANASIMNTEGHGSSKIQKMSFADGPYVFSSGFNSKGYRELRLYDTRNFNEAIQSHKIDTLQGMLSNYYDHDTGMAYVFAKGESLVHFLEIKEGTIKPGNTYTSQDQATGISFFPKRTMDYNQSELARAAKLTKDSIHYVSFKYPRRNQGFNEEFYPECISGEPSLSVEEWKNGETKDVIRKKINEIENKFKSEPVVFEKKDIVERKTVSFEFLYKENIELKARIEQLEREAIDLREFKKNYEAKETKETSETKVTKETNETNETKENNENNEI